MTSPAALTVPPVLQRWAAWRDLRRAGRDHGIPSGPGLYRIRRAGGEPGLDYIGQTGRSLRGRLGQLGGAYHAQMPYRDPHTAAPALWALRHRDGCEFEVAVIEVPGTVPQRKALEATAITWYRMESGRSPAASFGRMPAGYRMSSGNNARLAAAGRRFRGGPDPAAPAGPASVPVHGLPSADPASADWMGWAWSRWAPISRARRSAAGTRLYRVRSSCHAGLVYAGQGTIALRLRAHAAKALAAGHRQGPSFSGDLEASWTALPGLPPVSLLEHENDLIAAHVLTTGQPPAAQFLGNPDPLPVNARCGNRARLACAAHRSSIMARHRGLTVPITAQVRRHCARHSAARGPHEEHNTGMSGVRGFVGVTDGSWYRLLADRPDLLGEVNFWRPGGGGFRALRTGEPFFFKTHAPHNWVVGGVAAA